MSRRSEIATWAIVNVAGLEKLGYHDIVTLSKASVPAPVVVKSYRVPSVALGVALAVRAAVVQFTKMTLGRTILRPEGGQ